MTVNVPLDAAGAARVINFLQQTGFIWRIPLIRAVAAERINLIQLQRGAGRAEVRRGLHQADKSECPALVLIGDDDYRTTGPAGWAGSSAVLRWAEAAIINATGGDANDYERFVTAAEAHRRLVLIETSSAAAAAWRDAAERAGRKRLLMMTPCDGAHPTIAQVRQ